MSRRIRINDNQLALPFGQAAALHFNLENRRYYFWALASVSILSLMVYIYAIQATAKNVAMRQNLETRLAEVNGQLTSLEFSYIELKNNIDLDTARAYGFEETEDELYVSRNAAKSLTLNTPNSN